MSSSSSSSENLRQWRIVALAVVSSSGRPLFLKNFPANLTSASSFSNALFRSNSLAPADSSTVCSDDNENDDDDAEAFKEFAKETQKSNYLSSWAHPQEGGAVVAPSLPTSGSSGKKDSGADGGQSSSVKNKHGSNNSSSEEESKMDLDQALSLALDCEDYTETETAQLFLYAALDRIDARRATEERRSGNPFESRGYAVFDRETKTKMKAFVLVRYWGRSLPSECHLPCQTVLTHLIQKATYAFCDPFRDVALDEPLSETLLMDPFFRDILQPATELPKPKS